MEETRITDPKAEIERLEAEIADLGQEQAQCGKLARELMEKEARGEGFFAAEIYEQKQRSLVLATQIQHLRVRINWIKIDLPVE